MANDRSSYESSLLRVVIGFLHISLSEQLALTRHGKAFHLLTQEEKDGLQGEMIGSVMTIARQVGEEAIEAFLKPPPPLKPGPVN